LFLPGFRLFLLLPVSLLVVVFVFFACISSLPSFALYTLARALLAIVASWEWRKIDGLWGWK
jgi:hypothetical protein